VTIVGIGSALWGLLVGGLAMIWLGWGRRPKPDAAALEEPEPHDAA
jgi:hypothetical protein